MVLIHILLVILGRFIQIHIHNCVAVLSLLIELCKCKKSIIPI